MLGKILKLKKTIQFKTHNDVLTFYTEHILYKTLNFS